MRVHRLLLSALLLLTAGRAHADTFLYTFAVTNLSNNDADFTLNIETDGLIAATGIQSLSVAQPTPLGFSVTRFGENGSGWYAFSGDNEGSIYDTGLIYGDEFFDFIPSSSGTGFDVVGSYPGSLSGNDPSEFSANANLVITNLSTAAVTPEPSSVWLLGTGVMSMTPMFRRRRPDLT